MKMARNTGLLESRSTVAVLQYVIARDNDYENVIVLLVKLVVVIAVSLHACRLSGLDSRSSRYPQVDRARFIKGLCREP